MFSVLSTIALILFYHSTQCNCGRPVVVPVTPPVQHGEGPIWDSKHQVLYYVDTFAPTILRWQPKYNSITSQKLEGDSVGVIIPVAGFRNRFIVCHDRRVSSFIWNGRSNNSGTLDEITSVDQDKPHNQFNDGKADAVGRLWAGTLTRNEDLSVTPYGGSLFSIESGDLPTSKVQISPVSISNGLAWSKDNTKFFYIDSETRKIVVYNFKLCKGIIDSPKILFDLEDHQYLQGIPDGMTIDGDDNLWVALYGGKLVIKVNSVSGELLDTVEIPATYVTSVAFGGPKFNILYVTTSKLKLTSEEQQQEPSAGCVFAVYNLGVQGWADNSFALVE